MELKEIGEELERITGGVNPLHGVESSEDRGDMAFQELENPLHGVERYI